MSGNALPRLSRPAVFLLVQLLALAAAWALLGGWSGCREGGGILPRLQLPVAWTGGGGGGGGTAAPIPHTSNVSEWEADPDSLAFLAPQSRCLLEPRGAAAGRLQHLCPSGGGCGAVGAAATANCGCPCPLPNARRPASCCAGVVQLSARRGDNGTLPFLFDTDSMPGRNESCGHCPPDRPNNPVPTCCGVCVFASRKCEDFYPGVVVPLRSC